MNKSISLLAGLLIGLLIGAGGYWAWQTYYSAKTTNTTATTTTTSTTSTPTPATTSTPSGATSSAPTSGATTPAGSTYTNTKYHYSLTVPAGYETVTTDDCGNQPVASCNGAATATSKEVTVQLTGSDKNTAVTTSPSLQIYGLAQADESHNIEPYNYLGFITDASKATKTTLAGHVAYTIMSDASTKITAAEIVKDQLSVLIYQRNSDTKLQGVMDSFAVVQ